MRNILHIAILLLLEFMRILISCTEIVVGDIGEGRISGGDQSIGLVIAVEEIVELVGSSLAQHHVVNYNNMLKGENSTSKACKRDKNKKKVLGG